MDGSASHCLICQCTPLFCVLSSSCCYRILLVGGPSNYCDMMQQNLQSFQRKKRKKLHCFRGTNKYQEDRNTRARYEDALSCTNVWYLQLKVYKLYGSSISIKESRNQGSLREGVQMKKTFLNGHCPFRGGGGRPLSSWFGPFFTK